MSIIIGISGGVASGKNFVSECFVKFGANIFDADLEVKKLFAEDNSFKELIKKTFPEIYINDQIDKNILATIIFEDKNKLQILENIIHPIIAKKLDQFIVQEKANKTKIILLNIPLLFEKESYKKCDITILVISDINLRKDRFINRESGKNLHILKEELTERFNKIILNQKTDTEKLKMADFVINNNSDKDDINKQIKVILNKYENNNC